MGYIKRTDVIDRKGIDYNLSRIIEFKICLSLTNHVNNQICGPFR